MYLSIFLASRISHFSIIIRKRIFLMQPLFYLLSPCRFSLTHKLYSLIFITSMCICSDDNNFWNILPYNKRYSHWVTKYPGTERLELSRMILLNAVTYRKKKYGASIYHSRLPGKQPLLSNLTYKNQLNVIIQIFSGADLWTFCTVCSGVAGRTRISD